jgi:hypothetical protein
MENKKAEKHKQGMTVDYSQYAPGVKKSYVPEGFESQEGFLEDMRAEYQADIDYDRENREAAMDDKRFAAGEQWDPIVLQQRKGLPCLVINSVPQFTAQLVGDWRENKKAVKVVPSENNDTDVADVRGDLIRAIEMKSRATRVYDTTFESMVQCGDGAYRIAVEYATDEAFDQEIYVRPIDDALSCVWDRMSVDPTGRDARRVFVDDLVPEKEFLRKWPDADPSTLEDTNRSDMYTYGWVEDRGIKVTEYWRIIERDRLLALFEDGSTRFLDADNIDTLVEKHGSPVKTRLAPCRYAQMHLTTGYKILSGPFEYRLNRLPIIRMTGRVVNSQGRRVRYGLVRFMKDPVRLKNFWRSVAAEQLGYAPKAQWIATEEAVSGREETFRKAHMSRDPLIVVNDEAVIGQNIQRLDPPAPQAALLNEAQVNAQDMKDVTGIHDASLGMRSNETSGRAINARQREGDIASLTYYDNGNQSILEGGDVINQLITQVYDGTRIIRIIGEDEAIKFMRINDPNDPESPDLSIGNYDVALTTGASYTTRRVEAAQAMMEAVQVDPRLMEIAGDLIVKAQDWPGHDEISERLKMANPLAQQEGEQTVPAAAVQQMQAEMQQQMQAMAQEFQQLQQDKSLEAEKLRIDMYNAETQRLKALADVQHKDDTLEMDALHKIVDTSTSLRQMEDQKEARKEQKESTVAGKPTSSTNKSQSGGKR